MNIWQVDFYKRPSPNDSEVVWELLACDRAGTVICNETCPQSQANAQWVAAQLQQAAGDTLPDRIQVFRPQSSGILTLVGEQLNVPIEATRRTLALKRELEKRGEIQLKKPPPQALPDRLWGDSWRFVTLPAGELIETFRDRAIPILHTPEDLNPLTLGIASATPIPGIIIYGGRQSMQLARWLQEAQPVAINYIPTVAEESGGLVLEAGLVDRWILVTFEDRDVAQAAQGYNQRLKASQGLHFCLVQPDDSGITDTGFWLLQEDR
ncbi:Tab2/Atab2 family RNA-binding protein [Lusitaniella coriacea LEGE 07157]|uniref:Tab2/Atab2 family RNA-binding protein n=1 Tax=Lusitaniella coriacea LEGE 07157 TaxID=945747 RepID=A0A8J7DZM4_9CYAN|nr:Tab2/Atab2 family RNA-binding protein [Lusitaniella coriacea]MBE9118581.1 Tab2/Atab2 family RNA-binding protein [Lusitaniella coriacea LEGE 07157]